MSDVRPLDKTPAIGVEYWLAGLAAAGLAFWFNFNFVLNHFAQGPYLYDTGWFAGMIYHPTWNLIAPMAMGEQASFYNTHISPLLYLLGLPSYFLPDVMPVYYAKVLGVVYGTLGLTGAIAAEPLTRKWGWRGPLAAGLIGLGLAFSGISLAAIGFPHYEPLYAGLAGLFLALLLRGKWQWAALPFGLALLVREDCGLHLFGILILLFLCSWPASTLRPGRRRLLGYALAGLAFSIAEIILQKTFYHGDNALQRIYLGEPSFAHVTAALIKQRLGFYLHANKYILAPGLLLTALAGWRRSWLLLAGVVAVLPWVVVNFLAKSNEAGEIHTYYAFPLLVMLIWPLLIYPVDPRRPTPGAALLGSGVVLGSSLLFFILERSNDFGHLEKFGATPAVFSVRDYEQGRQLVKALEKQTPDILFDGSVAAMYPMDISAPKVHHRDSHGPVPQVLAGFWGGYDHAEAVLNSSQTWQMYVLPNPHLYILSQTPLPAGLTDEFSLMGKGPQTSPVIFPDLLLGPYAQYEADDAISDTTNHADAVVEYGPYVRLAEGRYTVHFEWEATSATHDDWLTFAVTSQSGKTILVKTEIRGADWPTQPGLQTVTLDFQSQGTDELEFILRKSGGVKIKLKNIRLEKIDITL